MQHVEPYQFEPERPSSSESGESEENYSFESNDSEASDELFERLTGEVNAWCRCTNCTIMETEEECTCCVEQRNVRNKMQDEDISCITLHPGFEVVCLNIHVLNTAYRLYARHFIRRLGLPNNDPNARFRYTAYRQFVGMIYRNLGERVRVIIPSCVINRIRERFPSPDNVYKGYLHV